MNDQTLSNLLDKFRIDIAERMQRENIPGLSIALIDAEATLWEAGFGVTDKQRKLPVSASTVFSLQSCSKTFTATAILIAVQEGLLSLDVPIQEYLPGFTFQSRFEPHPEAKITLRHLLSHKAGFTNEAPVGNNFVYDSGSSSFEAHIESIRKTWLRFPVGQRYSYSSVGIDLAGYILQEVSETPFPEYLRTKLFDPLGMTRSSFDFKVIAADEDRAVGHDAVYETIGLPTPLVVPMIPSGGIYSSAEDIARYIRFHLNAGRAGDQNILDRKYMEEMYTIPWPVTGQIDGYALGISVNRHHGTRRFTHGGGGFGFLSDMLWYPELEIGIVILTNSSNHRLQWWYANQLLDKVLDLPAYQERKMALPAAKSSSEAVPTPVKNIASQNHLVGHYVGRLPNQCNVKLAGEGMTIRFGWEKKPKPLHFYTDDEAFVQDTGAITVGDKLHRYRFVRNEADAPAYFIHLQDGSVYDYNEGPNDPPGMNKSEWGPYLGDYSAKSGRFPMIVSVQRRKGHLFLNFGCRLKLEEYQPGLFFTTTGEAFDSRNGESVFAGIILQKIGFNTKINYGIILLKTLFRTWRLRVSAGLRLQLKK